MRTFVGDDSYIREASCCGRFVGDPNAASTGESMLIELDVNDCWNRIGVKGDGSCPELQQHVHCRNCPVYAGVGQRLFDREPPASCVEEWTQQIAHTEPVEPTDTAPILVFRCGDEWFGLHIGRVIEVGEPRTVHRIPHRSNKLLLGLVNIRGELKLCVALRELLGIDASDPPTRSNAVSKSPSFKSSTTKPVDEVTIDTSRLLVVERESQVWAFVVDEVAEVTRLPLSELGNVPATIANSLARHSRGVFRWGDRAIGYLDDERLFEQLRRAIG